MKSYYLVLAAFILVLLLVNGCAKNIQPKSIMTQEDKDFMNTQSALSSQDASVCDKIADLSSRNDCNYQVAVSTKDTKICDKISDQKDKDACYYAPARSPRWRIPPATACDRYPQRTGAR